MLKEDSERDKRVKYITSYANLNDIRITFGSVHEVRAFRERKKRSLWFSARFSFWLIKVWKGIFKVFEDLFVDA